jgi:hypothetical protein
MARIVNDARPGYSAGTMEPKPLLRVGGAAWELARTFLLLAFLSLSSSSAGTADMLSAPWLAALGAAGLVMPAAFVMFAAAPRRHVAFLPLLRLGKTLETATILFLFASGAVSTVVALPGAYLAAQALRYPPLVFGVAFALDLLVLVGLVRVREGSDPTGTP